MSVAFVGVSHHTAPVAVRERFVFRREQAESALVGLVEAGIAAEAVLLSTCNRTELYLVGQDSALDAGAALLAEQAGFDAAVARGYFRIQHGRDVARHLYRVASGLDSMILGEAQIQGQVRSAYEIATGARRRVVGPVLARLFEGALGTGGRVRSETDLGSGAASVPSAAVELARKIFGSLRGRKALVIGSGEMSDLLLECLNAEGVKSVVASRRAEQAQALADRRGSAATGMEDVTRFLAEADVVVSATGAPHIVLTRDAVERAFPGGPRGPLLIIDIALPRDVEEAVGELPNVFLYDIDDIGQIVQGTLERRKEEATFADRIVETAAEDFWHWYLSRDAAPVIRALHDRAEGIRRAELERAFRKLDHLSEADRAVVERLSRLLVAKMLHEPTVWLRESAANGGVIVDAARSLLEGVPLGREGADGAEGE